MKLRQLCPDDITLANCHSLLGKIEQASLSPAMKVALKTMVRAKVAELLRELGIEPSMPLVYRLAYAENALSQAVNNQQQLAEIIAKLHHRIERLEEVSCDRYDRFIIPDVN